MGWYLHCLYTHLYKDTRKSDYLVMLIHHIVTLALLYGSYVTGYFRIGMLVMFSMDLCDVFVFGAKVLKIMDASGQLNLPPWGCFFVYSSLPLVWLALRLVYFPMYILHTTVVGTRLIMGGAGFNLYLAFNTLLLILFSLQVWWFGVICNIGYVSWKKGNTKAMDDLREEGAGAAALSSSARLNQDYNKAKEG